ncbi:MAG: ABC transporter substrate-binding protein [Alphaproteobacteria bacterium]|nr:ABC transporter substrate-binding protein [Alphaproteobacteria bacterium]
MKKGLAAAATMIAGLLLAGAAAAQSCEPKLGHPPLVRKGYIIAAINPTVAPIQYINEDGEIIGLNVDFGNAIAKRLCLTMQFQSTQFATMIPILKEGRIDLINSFMFYTPERAAQVLMVPYGAQSYVILASKKNTDEIKGFEYFSGKPFATELGTVDYRDAKAASDELVKAGKAPIDIRTFGTYADVLQALSAGQVAGAIVGIEQAVYYRKKGADFFRIAVSGFEPHAEALAFKDSGLADAVAKVMNEMKADGSFDKIFEPYGHCVLPGPYKVTSGELPKFTCPARKD